MFKNSYSFILLFILPHASPKKKNNLEVFSPQQLFFNCSTFQKF
jgi:hypothetical protein